MILLLKDNLVVASVLLLLAHLGRVVRVRDLPGIKLDNLGFLAPLIVLLHHEDVPANSILTRVHQRVRQF